MKKQLVAHSESEWANDRMTRFLCGYYCNNASIRDNVSELDTMINEARGIHNTHIAVTASLLMSLKPTFDTVLHRTGGLQYNRVAFLTNPNGEGYVRLTSKGFKPDTRFFGSQFDETMVEASGFIHRIHQTELCPKFAVIFARWVDDGDLDALYRFISELCRFGNVNFIDHLRIVSSAMKGWAKVSGGMN